MTLAGTNTYLVRVGDAVWVVDPGPADRRHVEAVATRARRLGRPAGLALTHDHGDHGDGVTPLLDLLGDLPVLRFGCVVTESPLAAVHTPGHASDHVVFTIGDVLFSGDLILGGSSTIVPPGGGTLIAYLDSLRAVAALAPRVILPGHGDPITAPVDAVNAQIAHRLAREDALLAALAAGVRDREELLDRAWADVPPALRIAAHVTMQSHLEALDLRERLPDDFEPAGRRGWGHR